MSQSVVKSLVGKLLEQPFGHDWSIQGLGMLRLYLDEERRLHIWDSRYKVENVSQIHTHPWNFKSLVVAGKIHNQRSIAAAGEPTHFEQTIFCGVGGGLIGEATRVRLVEQDYETYEEGDTYSELAHEIHLSKPLDGTVTIVKREFLDDVDHALVFWEEGDWVSAEPRKATDEEIYAITQNSLRTWWHEKA